MKRVLIALAAAMAAGSVHAEVTDRSAAGFEVVEKATIAAPSGKIWDGLIASEHVYSAQPDLMTQLGITASAPDEGA